VAPITDAYRLADGRALRGRWDSSIPEELRSAWRDPHVADAMVERVLALDPTSESRTPASARVPLGYFAESCEMTAGRQLWDAAAITTPTLVIRGERDFWSRPEDLTTLERTLGSRARSRFVTIPNATHHLFLDRPDRGRQQFLDEALRFFASADR
jgi:pimeloyl-ACP methyl ester carboxylesterase